VASRAEQKSKCNGSFPNEEGRVDRCLSIKTFEVENPEKIKSGIKRALSAPAAGGTEIASQSK
jgi:hypothetical protein